MQKKQIIIKTLLCAFVICSAFACSRSPRVTYYTLSSPEEMPMTHSAVTSGCTISVSRVTVPELLDRPQLIIHRDKNRIEKLESHRWAETLKIEIQRAVAINLERLLQPVTVRTTHQNAIRASDLEISIDIIELDAIPGKRVNLEVLWELSGKNSIPLNNERFAAQEAVASNKYDEIVSAHAKVITKLSEKIATEISHRTKSMVCGEESNN